MVSGRVRELNGRCSDFLLFCSMKNFLNLRIE